MKQWTVAAGLALGLALVGCGRGEPVAVTKPAVGQGVPVAGEGHGLVLEGVVQAPERRSAAVARPEPVRRVPRGRVAQQQAAEAPFEGVKLALVHTANVVGELEPCG